MIIDCHGHYTTAPKALENWRNAVSYTHLDVYKRQLYALDVERLDVAGTFNGADARQAMAGHVLAEAAVAGVYALNPAVATALR